MGKDKIFLRIKNLITHFGLKLTRIMGRNYYTKRVVMLHFNINLDFLILALVVHSKFINFVKKLFVTSHPISFKMTILYVKILVRLVDCDLFVI